MRERGRHGWLAAAVAACALLGVLMVVRHARAAQQPQNPDAKLAAEFLDRVKKYLELHKKLEATIPPLPTKAGPEQVEQHQRQLERLIANARAGAKPGEIFAEPIRAYFRRQLARAFSGPEGAEALRTIMDENPRTVRLQVNSRYPEGLPVTNMPPQVLLLLPNLPPELEYRFVGNRLVLLDVHADMVVDYIDNAFTV